MPKRQLKVTRIPKAARKSRSWPKFGLILRSPNPLFKREVQYTGGVWEIHRFWCKHHQKVSTISRILGRFWWFWKYEIYLLNALFQVEYTFESPKNLLKVRLFALWRPCISVTPLHGQAHRFRRPCDRFKPATLINYKSDRRYLGWEMVHAFRWFLHPNLCISHTLPM